VFSVNNKKMFKKIDFFYFLHKSDLNRTWIIKARKFEMFTTLLSENVRLNSNFLIVYCLYLSDLVKIGVLANSPPLKRDSKSSSYST